MQGQTTDTLPLFDRALAVTQADPALTDLRLLLQINKAVTLGNLDRYEEAVRRGPGGAAPGQPGRHSVRRPRRTAPWASCCSTPGTGPRRLAEVQALH